MWGHLTSQKNLLMVNTTFLLQLSNQIDTFHLKESDKINEITKKSVYLVPQS